MPGGWWVPMGLGLGLVSDLLRAMRLAGFLCTRLKIVDARDLSLSLSLGPLHLASLSGSHRNRYRC